MDSVADFVRLRRLERAIYRTAIACGIPRADLRDCSDMPRSSSQVSADQANLDDRPRLHEGEELLRYLEHHRLPDSIEEIEAGRKRPLPVPPPDDGANHR